jgi:hypothetical protein
MRVRTPARLRPKCSGSFAEWRCCTAVGLVAVGALGLVLWRWGMRRGRHTLGGREDCWATLRKQGCALCARIQSPAVGARPWRFAHAHSELMISASVP